jgi:acetoin utilization protein AcuB
MKVKECVTQQVMTIAPEATTKEAFGTMKSLGIRHLVVVRHGRIVGIVTDRDLRRPKVADVFKSWEELYRISDEFHVEDIMSSPVTTIAEGADIKQAAQILVEKRIGALPVTDAAGTLTGIITDLDLLRALIAG